MSQASGAHAEPVGRRARAKPAGRRARAARAAAALAGTLVWARAFPRSAALAAIASLAVLACATTPPTGLPPQENAPVTTLGAPVEAQPPDEPGTARAPDAGAAEVPPAPPARVHHRKLPPATLLLPDDAPLARTVAELGSHLARHAPPSVAAVVRFRVLDVPQVNAFAVATGEIYVTRGLLALVNHEDELAHVLGHELAHVIAAHHRLREALPATWGRSLATLAALAAYSRAQEREADRVGQRLAAAAGHDPTAMVRFLHAMDALARLRTGTVRRAAWLDTHPTAVARATAASVRSGFTLADARAAVHDPGRAAWLARVEGMLLGANPALGVQRGALFLHPGLGFAVRFPEGWRVEQQPRAVFAYEPGRKAALALFRQGPGSDPAAAARSFAAAKGAGWTHARGAPTRVRGLPAYQVEATDLAGPAPRALRGTWIAWGGWIYRVEATFVPMAARDVLPAVRTAERSFRPLPDDAIAALEVERLRLATTREGETLADLGARTQSAWPPAEAAVMNALPASEPLPGGLRVKIARREGWLGAEGESKAEAR